MENKEDIKNEIFSYSGKALIIAPRRNSWKVVDWLIRLEPRRDPFAACGLESVMQELQILWILQTVLLWPLGCVIKNKPVNSDKLTEKSHKDLPSMGTELLNTVSGTNKYEWQLGDNSAPTLCLRY